MVDVRTEPHGEADVRLRLTNGRRRDPAPGRVLSQRTWSGPAVAPIVEQARRAVTEFAATGVSSARLGDFRICVSEAVSNVVVHAFDEGGPRGTITISATVGPDAVIVVITDDGKGFQIRNDSPGLGLGLRLIGTLADSLSVARAARGGTEVSIRFDSDQSGLP
jgi:anti-sigma regulatory factor (Ser/Thr protein kinase)